MKTKIFIAAAVLFSSSVSAQTDSTKKLNEVVVTATKFPIKQALTGKVVTVISKEQLERNARLIEKSCHTPEAKFKM